MILQHREFAFVAHGVVEREAVLLNRAKLGRALRAHDVASAEERVAHHLFCLLESLPARVLADFNDVALDCRRPSPTTETAARL